jgi:predicted ArsR family transcriptional regulator
MSRLKRKLSLVEELKDEALKLLASSQLPLGVMDVAKKLDVSWTTARAILLTLEAEGKVSSLKTSKSKVYFLRQGDGCRGAPHVEAKEG